MKKAIFTYARNESLYLPMWIRHHAKSFPIKDIYLLDNDTCDGSVEKAISEGLLLRENVFRITCKSDPFTSQWLSNQASEFQEKLLNKYEWTILAEIDEFIAIDPSFYSNWDSFLEDAKKLEKSVFRATGYDVVHDVKNETKIDLQKNILSQRNKARLWLPELNNGKMLFSKPILAREKVSWRAGGHDIMKHNDPERKPLPVEIIKGLLLFHLNMFDYDLCSQRRIDRVPAGQSAISGDRLFIGEQLLKEMNHYLSIKGATVTLPERFRELL